MKVKSNVKTSAVRWYGADSNEDMVAAAIGKLGTASVKMVSEACGLHDKASYLALMALCESGRVEKGRARFADGKIVAAYRLIGK